MLRSSQEKKQLVRKFEEIVPMLKNLQTFGWIAPECDADPVYRVIPSDYDLQKATFRGIEVNVKTGWHSEYMYRDDRGVHRVREGIVPIKNEWSDYCYRSNCICKDK